MVKKVLSLAIVCILLLGFAQSALADSEAPRTITVTSSQAGFDISPFSAGNVMKGTTNEAMYSALFYSPYPGAPIDEYQGAIGKSFEIVDETTISIELYDYVTDSQGNTIDANDVKYSYAASAQAGDNPSVAQAVSEVVVDDDMHVTIKLTNAAVGVMESVITSVNIIDGDWFENASAEDRSLNPATTGPYRVQEAVPGSRVVLEKLDNYWQTDESLIPDVQKANFDVVNFMIITEPTQCTIALENGEVDLSQIQASEVERFMNEDGTAKDGWTIYSYDLQMFRVLFFNMDPASGSPLADNIKLREAVTYAIDRESVRLGAGETATSGGNVMALGSPSQAGYDPDWEYYEYDVERAKQALADAGYSEGELTLRLLYSADTAHNGACTVIQSNLAEIGINCELVGVDMALFNTYKYDSSQWDIILDAKGGSAYITDTWTQLFDSSGYENGGVNFNQDKTIEQLAIDASLDFTEENLNAFNDYLMSQYQAVGLYYSRRFNVAQNGITEIAKDASWNPNVWSSTVADDYQSVVK